MSSVSAAPPAHRPTDGPPRALRGEIQALRALAVALVVLFHLWPGRVPGGYVGVDVFFVISGFLITGHLLREAESTGGVRLGRFWARRARRLLPAAYLVVAVTVAATLLVAPPALWQQWFREILGATLYAENWVLAADAVDYLAAEADPSPVQHYWSLSTEEQFYLVWPLLVLASAAVAVRVRRSTRAIAGVVLAAATLASFAYSLWLTVENPASAYFVTPTRAWQFGAGALLALLLARPDRRPVLGDGVRAAVSWTGLAAILACALLYDAGTPFPGTAALGPVLAAAAVIWAGTPTGRLSPAPLLGWRPVRYTADISYSLYLWHWPVIVFAPFALGHDPGLVERVLLLAGAVLLSALTKRYVEDPVRFARRWDLHRTRRVLGLTAASTVVLALAAGCALGVAKHRVAEQEQIARQVATDPPDCLGAGAMDPEDPCHNPDLDGLLVPAPEATEDDVAEHPECWVDVYESDLRDCDFGPVDDPDVPHVALVGDSHARAMLPAFLELARQGRISLTAHLKSGCAWTTGAVSTEDEKRADTCEEWKGRLQPWLEEHTADTDVVVTTAYLKMLSGDADRKTGEMAAAWRPVTEAGVPVVALSDNPWHDFQPSRCLEEKSSVRSDSCDVSTAEAFPFDDTFRSAAEAVDGATYVDMTRYYCTDGRCPSVIGGVNVYRDSSHLTTTFTRTLTPYLLRELRATGALE